MATQDNNTELENKSIEVRDKLAQGNLTHEETLELLNELQLLTEGASPSDVDEGVTDLTMQMIATMTPEERVEYRNKVKKKGLVSDVINTVLKVGDIAIANQQIKEGINAAKASRKPDTPRKYRFNPTISKSIRDTLNSMSPIGIESSLRPYKDDIIDSYKADIENAKTASGGQAGSFGSMAQGAVTRRLRNAGQLQGQRYQINSDLRKNLNYALQNRLGEEKIAMSRDLNVYKTDTDQYAREQLAAGRAEAVGRQNRRYALYGLAPIASRIIAGGIDKIDGIKNSSGVNDPSTSTDEALGVGKQPLIDFEQVDGINAYDDMITDNIINDAWLMQSGRYNPYNPGTENNIRTYE